MKRQEGMTRKFSNFKMDKLHNLFKDFPREREQKLKSIKRYSMFDVFYYRSNLWHHSIRVSLLVNEFSEIVKNNLPKLDLEKAKILALIHDDAEMITGDIQLGHKQQMTEAQLKEVENDEKKAIEQLATTYPKEIGGYNYRELLYSALTKDSLEAQLVGCADKLDAYCESLHEVLGGNISALRAVTNYVRVLKDLKEKFPDLKPIFKEKNLIFTTTDFYTDSWRVHKENYSHLGKPHTSETIRKETEFVLYNMWKNLVINNLGDEGINILITKKEDL